MINRIFLSLVVSVTITASAVAQDASIFTPHEHIKIPLRSVSGQSLDIIGLKMGMPFAEAETILGEHLKGKEFRKESRTLSGSVNGFSVKTTPFTQRIIFEDNTQSPVRENIVAAFSSPASGSKLISVQRMVTYSGAEVSPTLENVKKSIIEKYGQPFSISDNSVTITFNYPYRNAKATKCISLGKGAESCAGFGNHGYQPERVNSEQAELKSNDDFLISVSAWRLYNSDRVSSVTSEMSDFAARLAAYRADNMAIQEQAKALQAAKPAPQAPKL